MEPIERKLDQSKFARSAFVRPPESPKDIRCNECRREFPIPWEAPLKFEHKPFKSADGATWVLAGVPINCPYCKSENLFNIETTPCGQILVFFGDEASRDPIKGWYPLAYGLVAIYEEHVLSLRSEFLALKQKFIPHKDPATWTLHVKDLRSDKRRKRICQTITIEQANEFLRRVAKWIGSQNDKFALYVGLSISRLDSGSLKTKQAFFKSCRDLLMQAILPTVTDSCTRSHITPRFVFEAQARITQQPFVEEWIERISRGQRLSLLHHYIARGHDLAIPRSAPKGDDFRLELADLLAFSMARYLHCKAIKRVPEIDLESFGAVQYGAYVDRHFGLQSGIGFPWRHFYGDDDF